MRWYALVSLMMDSRVKFLLGFVIVAVILAVILTLIEFRLKRKREKKITKVVNETAIDKMRKFLKQDKTPREKLNFIDKTAKEYFNETYGTSLHANYSTLIDEFDKRQLKNKDMAPEGKTSEKVSPSLSKDEIEFCKIMFSTYYSDKKLSSERLNILTNLLISMEKHKRRKDDISEVSPYVEKAEKVFEKVISTVVRKKIKLGRNNAGWIEKTVAAGWKIIIDYNKKYGRGRDEERDRRLLRQKKFKFRQEKFRAIERNKVLEKEHMARRKVALRLERIRREKIRKQTLSLQRQARKELAEIKRRKAVLWKVAKQDAIARRKITEEKQRELDRQKKIVANIHGRREELRKSVSRKTIRSIEKGIYETSKIKSSIKNIGIFIEKKRKAFIKRKKAEAEKGRLELVTKHIETKRKEKLRKIRASEIEIEKKNKKIAIEAKRKRARAVRIVNVKSSIKNIIDKRIKRKEEAKKIKKVKLIENDISRVNKNKQNKVANVKSSMKNIDDFFNKDKYTDLERKRPIVEEKNVAHFIKNKVFRIGKKDIGQESKVKPFVENTRKFFNKEKSIVDRENKKLIANEPRGIFVHKTDAVEPREEGIAERIVRQEKLRLEKGGVYNMEF